ncbi:MAG: protein kinase [Polyangia bacterium]
MDCIQCGTSFDFSSGTCPQCGWNPNASHDPLGGYRPGELVRGRYEVDESLGSGRLGTVLKAVDLETDSEVAVKLIHPALIPDEVVGRDFLKGMRRMVRGGHVLLNRVLDVNCEKTNYFVVYALLDGVPLRDLMDNRRGQGRSFTVDEILPIFRKIVVPFSEGVVEVHGSLSPENIWVLPENLKLLDAALAVHLPPFAVGYRLRSEGRVREYVAPELTAGMRPDARTDVFALGVLLGEMLTQVRYDGRPELFRNADPDLPEPLDIVLRRALLADPRGRHQSVAELVASIEEAAAGRSPTQPPRRAAAPPPARRRPAPPAPAREESERFDDLGDVAVDLDVEEKKDPPKKQNSLGWDDLPEETAQVSMADVIRAHVEGKSPGEQTPLPLARPSRNPPPAEPERPGTPPPPARRSSAPPPPPARRPSTPPPPRARHSSTPPPAAAHAVEPRRPQPLRRDSVPPPARKAAPPPAQRADAYRELDDGALEKLGVGGSRERREITQEIDVDALEAVESHGGPSEHTQEIEPEMIEQVERASTREAVSTLEKQALDADRSSTEELIRRAEKLEGVDPRFVRAAARLESERRGGRSRKAAELLKKQQQSVEGIDPRLLRAAARLEEARIGEITSVTTYPDDPKIRKESEEDWRRRMETSSDDSVISFIAPPVVEEPSQVRGFPRSVQGRKQSRPPATPPRRPPPRQGGRRREPSTSRALYDDSGETDDESQPTILLRASRLRPSWNQLTETRALRLIEIALPIVVFALLAATVTLLTLAVVAD